MGDKTAISWTDASWNPVTGCSKVSAGCAYCYAEALSLRHKWSKKPWTPENAAENVILHPDRLNIPLHWGEPKRIFVCSMADLFHERVSDSFIAAVFYVMREAKQHIFQVLTKRPERMREWCELYGGLLPLPNVWLGVSVENQHWADQRIPLLLQTPAAVRFLSCEPLLGHIDLTPYLGIILKDQLEWSWEADPWYAEQDETPRGIDWVIVGGESGPGYRPMNVDWARSIRDQCQEAGVSFFYKQSSGVRPGHNATLEGVEWHQWPRVGLEA